MKCKWFERKSISILIALLISIGAIAGTACDVYAEGDNGENACTLTFEYPKDVVSKDVKIVVYDTIPQSSWGMTYDDEGTLTIGNAQPIESSGDGEYQLTKAGTYCYYVHGDDYYSVCKLFNVTEDNISSNEKIELMLATDKLGGKGFEPCNLKLANAPEGYSENYVTDRTVMEWTDEIQKHFTSEDLTYYPEGGFKTPAFTNKEKRLHEVTHYDEFQEFISKLDKQTNYMHVKSLGKLEHYHYELPMVVFTTSQIPDNASIEEIGKILRENGKPTFWQQAQIHPNEPAAGEGALVMLQEMAGEYGKNVIEKINVVVIPWINPEGAYLFRRATYDGFDMNRDHMALKSKELSYIHTAYKNILPEVVVDNHEFGFYGARRMDGDSTENKWCMSDADDIQSTCASSLNNDPAVNELSMSVFEGNLHSHLKEAGLRNYHYGVTVNNPVGRAYYGLFNSVSILIETRGIPGGKLNFDRRVYSQVEAVKSLIKTTMDNATNLRSIVAKAREEVAKKGKTYEEDDVLVLYQTASGKTVTPFACERVRFFMDGTAAKKQSPKSLSMNDTIVRSRPRPTAYIIPKDVENLDKILYILDNQGAYYYEVAPGTVAPADQYYYIGKYIIDSEKGTTKGFEAGLRGEKSVTFDKGAVVIPMDQVAGNVIGMLMEPDVNDSDGYDGTLVQYGLVTSDDNGNFPYYRFIVDNPREALPSGGEGYSDSSSGCNAFGGIAGFLLIVCPAVLLASKKRK